MHQFANVPQRLARYVLAGLLIWSVLLIAADPRNTQAAGAASAPQATTKVFIPISVKFDLYADWVAFGQPAGSAAVNFLYTSQQCSGELPSVVLAGTDLGLYRLNGTAWEINTSLSAGISVAHIFTTATSGMFLGSYNQGLWHSADGGATWGREILPKNDTRIYWLAENDQYLFAAGSQGAYRRARSGGAWTTIRDTGTYTIAAANGKVFADEIGDSKDTLFVSSDNGATWPISRQLPGALKFVQTLDASASGPQVLIGTVGGGLYTLDGTNTLVPFSQGVDATVYGIWRDGTGRIYAAFEQSAGLRRFASSGGASELDLSALPGGASLAAENLYTVNGSRACNIIGVGSESGKVWLRRVP